MEDLTEKTKSVFESKIDGCIYHALDECITQVIDSAANDLFTLLRQYGKEYSKNGDQVLEDQKDILEAMRRLTAAIKRPLTLINEYKSNNS